MWAVLTRLEDPKKHNLSLLQKMKLYDGKVLPGYTQDTVKELRKEAEARGDGGHQPALRAGQDLERARERQGEGTINPFMVLNELDKGLRHHSLITSEEQRKRYAEIIGHREARVRGHREERGPARHQRRRGRDREAGRELHRQHQGVHAEGEGEEPLHRPGRGARTSA